MVFLGFRLFLSGAFSFLSQPRSVTFHFLTGTSKAFADEENLRAEGA